MGWSGYPVPIPVKRKAECDKANTWDEPNSSCRVLKSAMCGSVWYGACEFTNKKTGETKVRGVVCLTQVDNSEYCNFYIKEMDESMGPLYNDCPSDIIRLLSPTDNEFALAWRQKCLETVKSRLAKNKKLKRLPIGTIIEFKMNPTDMKPIRAVKRPPAYQFKSAWWEACSHDGYFKKKTIPNDFKVVAMGR